MLALNRIIAIGASRHLNNYLQHQATFLEIGIAMTFGAGRRHKARTNAATRSNDPSKPS
jgi:hypothetical protein